MAADIERNLLNHYKLTSLFPQEWPSTADDDDTLPVDAGLSEIERQSSKRSRRSSRFSSLDPQPVSRSRHSLPKENGGGSGNLVQKDEPDPLGIAPSVVKELRRRGVPVEEDLRLRNRFMLSSTTFSPALFLSKVHQTATTDDLLRGLDYLSRSIEQKSASLKILVESNFERFVKAKATIDNVYTEMRTRGNSGLGPTAIAAKRVSHVRNSSRGNLHSRNTSNSLIPATDPRLKNALTKESEYATLGIKAPLLELSAKAEELWRPALGGRTREEDLKSILSFVEQNRSIMQLAGNIRSSIRKQDHHTLVQDYNKARYMADDARNTINNASRNPKAELSEQDIRKTLVAAKVWHDVETEIDQFRRDSLRRLTHVQLTLDSARETDTALIAVLLQIGTEESPIWLWLSSWHDTLQARITRTFERLRLDMEILRRRIANTPEPTSADIKSCLEAAGIAGPTAHITTDKARGMVDRPQTLHFWELLVKSLGDVLRSQGGLLGEIVAFWEHAKGYIDGRTQQPLTNASGYTHDRRRHLYLTTDHARELQSRTVDLVTLVRDCITSLFTDPPVEDISDLVSPMPLSPIDAVGNRSRPQSLRVDKADLPPPSPRRGDAWEKYAFWPPHATSLSGALYLGRILALVATAAIDATAITIVNSNAKSREQLKNMVGSVRDRCVSAVCAAWNTDSEKSKVLEDWTRNSERRDLTNFPPRFMAFEEFVLINLQKIMYMSEATTRPGSNDIVIPPSARLSETVRQQFVTTIYKALSGTVENAERLKRGKDAVDDEVSALMAVQGPDSAAGGESAIESHPATHRNIGMLLTLSNLAHLRKEIIPQLISQFESLFSVKLAEDPKTIRDVLGQIDSRLFQSYIKPSVDKLASLVDRGVSPASWLPTVSRPTNAKAYVYDVLMYLVIVHTEVSTSATSLTNHVLSYLLEQVSLAILAAFKHRANYTLPALMQATLDVELIAQTLNTYTTERAGEIQGQIYLVLDERTEDAARTRLQSELPEMRATLKRLREGTRGQFGCFKRDRRAARSDKSAERSEKPAK